MQHNHRELDSCGTCMEWPIWARSIVAHLIYVEEILSDLTTAEGDLTAAVAGAVAELGSLSAQLNAALANNDQAALQDAANQIETQVQALNAATSSAQAPAATDTATASAPADTTGGDTTSDPAPTDAAPADAAGTADTSGDATV